MLSDIDKRTLRSLILGKYRDRSVTEFLKLLHDIHIAYVKDPTVVEQQLTQVYFDSQDSQTFL